MHNTIDTSVPRDKVHFLGFLDRPLPGRWSADALASKMVTLNRAGLEDTYYVLDNVGSFSAGLAGWHVGLEGGVGALGAPGLRAR